MLCLIVCAGLENEGILEAETETEKSPCIRLSLSVSKVIRMLPTVTGIGC